MLPNNVTTFAALASMAGPSFKGIKDQSGKMEGLDWFHVLKRRNVKAQQYALELYDRQNN